MKKVRELVGSIDRELSILCLVIVCIRFLPFFLGKTFAFADTYSLFVPQKLFTAYWIQQGVLPLWNPYIFAGIPWIGDISQSIFYPSTLAFIFLNPATAVNVTIIGHTLFTAIGMYAFAKKWWNSKYSAIVAAAFWVFSTQVSGTINNLVKLQTIVWVPWIFLPSALGHKHKYFSLILATSVAMQVLAGYPQFVLYTLLTSAFLSILKEFNSLRTVTDWAYYLWSWTRSILFALILSAIIWMPFLPTFFQSTRTLQTVEQSQNGVLHLSELTKLFLPYFFENPSLGMKWGPSWNGSVDLGIYITWFGVFLLFWLFFSKAARRVDFIFLGVTLGTILYSFGDSVPGFSFVNTIVPLLRFSRGPSMVLIATNAILAFWIADVVQRTTIEKKWFWRVILASVLTSSVACLLLLFVHFNFHALWNGVNRISHSYLERSGFHTLEKDKIIAFSILQNVLINSLSLTLCIVAWKKRKVAFLVLIVLIDLQFNTKGMLFSVPQTVYPTWQSIERTRRDTIHTAVNTDRVLVSNYNTPYTGFDTYWESMMIRRPFSDSYITQDDLETQKHMIRMQQGDTPDWNMVYGMRTLNGYTTLLPIDFDSVWRSEKEGAPSLNSVSDIRLDNPNLEKWAVSYLLVDTWFPNTPDTNEYSKVAQNESVQLFSLSTKKRFQLEKNDGKLQVIEDSPNRIILKIENPSPQKLTIADRYDSEWKASTGTSDIEISNNNGIRTMLLPAGNYTLSLRYEPTLYYVGLMVSILGIGGLIYELIRITQEKSEKKVI